MAVVAGNWKMHMGPAETEAFFREFGVPGAGGGHEYVVFPPALSLARAVASLPAGSPVRLGVQNVHWEESGAFTGEISVSMAREAGATFVLVGHSERRHVFGETDDEVARKVRAVQDHGLTPVVCVGETLDERRAGRVDEVILRQLDAALAGLGDDPGRFMVAYEPVWAIGTGETATPDDAQAAHGTLRERLAAQLGPERARGVPILYGGSVKPSNAGELTARDDVDGVLVGGASLDPVSFAAIAAACR
ncbi:MAG: triose-phosphate isomerase [Gemmatimonadota bacterium]|nr:triose-phosphate isomerase [Gemmatimonadota bacterium]MDH5759269.1 triose-phosphate isomerase [Gemmatimonadota bacterium]